MIKAIRIVVLSTLTVVLAAALWLFGNNIRIVLFPLKGDACRTWDGGYAVYDDKWRWIPLRVGPDGKDGIWLTGGQPVDMEDDEGDAWLHEFKLEWYSRVGDGNYVVKYDRTYYTVWTPRTLARWQAVKGQ